jgi:hypothetical protein
MLSTLEISSLAFPHTVAGFGFVHPMEPMKMHNNALEGKTGRRFGKA